MTTGKMNEQLVEAPDRLLLEPAEHVVHVFAVDTMLECPSISMTTRMGTPAASRKLVRVAQIV